MEYFRMATFHIYFSDFNDSGSLFGSFLLFNLSCNLNMCIISQMDANFSLIKLWETQDE